MLLNYEYNITGVVIPATSLQVTQIKPTDVNLPYIKVISL